MTRNHWIAKERADGVRYWGGDYDAVGCASAEEKPAMACDLCGGQAWFKPTVGRYVCTCGAVRHDGRWSMPTYPH